MANLNSSYSRWSKCMLSILRIVSALLFMQHGAQKLFGFLAPMQATSHSLLSLMGIAGVLEFFGGLLLVLGLFTRPVAFLLSGQMAVAYFMVHAPKGSGPFKTEVTWHFSGVLCSFTWPQPAEEHGAWIASGLVKDVDHTRESRNGMPAAISC